MVKPFISLSCWASRRLDSARDKKVCGRSLAGFVATPYSETHGATGSQSAPYKGLEQIFSHIKFCPEDSFIDVGCGKGRVLAYLIGCGAPCRISGIELNPEVAKTAREWASRYPGVNVIEGDAFGLDYNGYTVLFMYRPMETSAFMDFIDKLEKSLTHKITLIYYADGQSGYYLNGRRGWNLKVRKDIFMVGAFYIHREPQRYSVWEYKP